MVLPHNLWMAGGEGRPTPRSPHPGRVPAWKGSRGLKSEARSGIKAFSEHINSQVPNAFCPCLNVTLKTKAAATTPK